MRGDNLHVYSMNNTINSNNLSANLKPTKIITNLSLLSSNDNNNNILQMAYSYEQGSFMIMTVGVVYVF